jgi:hypothetical protein
MDGHSMTTPSGKSYGQLNLETLREIEEIADRVQTALGPSDPQGPKDLEKTRRLVRRLKNMLHLSRESSYWNIVLPAMMSRLAGRLWEIDEFWAPQVTRSLIRIIDEMQNP